jgi:hypothetical protein
MDTASARADLLLDIFLIRVEQFGTEGSFVERTLSHLELDLLDARDAPEHLLDATADTARALWAYNMEPTADSDQVDRDASHAGKPCICTRSANCHPRPMWTLRMPGA